MKRGRFKVVITAYYESEWEQYGSTPEEAAAVDAESEPMELLHLCEEVELTSVEPCNE